MEVTSAIPQEALRSIVQRTLDEMARVTAGSDGFVQNLIERLALEAYRAGTLDTLTELLTAGQAAAPPLHDAEADQGARTQSRPRSARGTGDALPPGRPRGAKGEIAFPSGGRALNQEVEYTKWRWHESQPRWRWLRPKSSGN